VVIFFVKEKYLYKKLVHSSVPAKPSRREQIVVNRNKNVQLTMLILVCLLIVLMINVILDIKIYFVYHTSIGPLLLMGIIIFLIVLLYFKG